MIIMKTRIIGIVSGKGGVGKTTTTSNLGAALSLLEKNTILVDGNLTTPNLSLHLGIPFYPYTLHDILHGKADIEDAIFYHKSGLKIIPASISLSAIRNINIKNFGRVIRSLEGRTEYVLVDSSPGLGKETREVIQHSDEVLVIVNPELPAITDALKVVKLAESLGTEIAGILLNRVKNTKHETSKEEIEDILEYPIIGVIPEDSYVHKSILKKMPVVFSYQNSKAARKFKEVASKISGERITKTLWDSIKEFFGF